MIRVVLALLFVVVLGNQHLYAMDLRTEVDARYGKRIIRDMEKMQSGIRIPKIQSVPEDSEREARQLKKEIVKSLKDPRRLQVQMDAVRNGLHGWASSPQGLEVKSRMPFKLRRQE